MKQSPNQQSWKPNNLWCFKNAQQDSCSIKTADEASAHHRLVSTVFIIWQATTRSKLARKPRNSSLLNGIELDCRKDKKHHARSRCTSFCKILDRTQQTAIVIWTLTVVHASYWLLATRKTLLTIECYWEKLKDSKSTSLRSQYQWHIGMPNHQSIENYQLMDREILGNAMRNSKPDCSVKSSWYKDTSSFPVFISKFSSQCNQRKIKRLQTTITRVHWYQSHAHQTLSCTSAGQISST